MDHKSARIDAIKAQERQRGGKTAAWAQSSSGKYLGHIKPTCQQVMRLIAPVIEIPSNQERRIRRHHLFDARGQRIKLTPTRARK